jgi:glycine/D-amino acid oxidase-like deaminating enzyme
MHRRGVLGGMTALAAMAASPLRAQGRRPRVIVVGAGIMGASIAYHLALRGAEVVVLERNKPGSQATQGAFAMLIASHEDGPRALNELYGAAVLDWRRLDMELRGELPIQWGGTLSWTGPGAEAEELNAGMRQAQAWGTALQPLRAEDFARLVPGVAPGAFGAGVFSPNQGTVDPQLATDVLVARGRKLGVEYRFPCEVRGLVADGGRVTAVETSQGRMTADVVVVAAGQDTDKLASPVGARAPHSVVSGALAHSAPHRRVLDRVLNGPEFSLKQNPDGRIVTGLDYRPGAKADDVSEAYGKRLLEIAARTVPAARGARLEKMTLGFVPIPKDGQPILGFARAPANLYLALTMSGITMAPMMGRFAAAEIVDGLTIETLSPYRPARFA